MRHLLLLLLLPLVLLFVHDLAAARSQPLLRDCCEKCLASDLCIQYFYPGAPSTSEHHHGNPNNAAVRWAERCRDISKTCRCTEQSCASSNSRITQQRCNAICSAGESLCLRICGHGKISVSKCLAVCSANKPMCNVDCANFSW